MDWSKKNIPNNSKPSRRNDLNPVDQKEAKFLKKIMDPLVPQKRF